MEPTTTVEVETTTDSRPVRAFELFPFTRGPSSGWTAQCTHERCGDARNVFADDSGDAIRDLGEWMATHTHQHEAAMLTHAQLPDDELEVPRG